METIIEDKSRNELMLHSPLNHLTINYVVSLGV